MRHRRFTQPRNHHMPARNNGNRRRKRDFASTSARHEYDTCPTTGKGAGDYAKSNARKPTVGRIRQYAARRRGREYLHPRSPRTQPNNSTRTELPPITIGALRLEKPHFRTTNHPPPFGMSLLWPAPNQTPPGRPPGRIQLHLIRPTSPPRCHRLLTRPR